MLRSSRLFSNISKSFKCHRMYSTHLPLTTLSDTELAMKEQVSQFARQHIKPYVKEMDESKIMREDVIKGCFELGLMGIDIPEEYGGSGMNFMCSIIAIEELAKIDPSVSVFVDVQNTLVNRIFKDFGNEEQKRQWLPRLTSDTVGSFCLSEPSSGSDAFSLKTTARKDGDYYILNGTKAWITNSGEAGVFLVMANVAPELGYKGITTFIVERTNPGLTVAKREDKLGIRASSTCQVILEECRVHKSSIVGEIGKGYKIAISTLNEGRVGIASQMLGLSQGAYDYALGYMKERKQFDTPIIDFQGIQFQYADAAARIQASRLLTYEAARLKEAGKPILKEAAIAKYFSSETAGYVSAKGVEWMGGVGFVKDYDAEKFYRDAMIGKIYEGANPTLLSGIAKSIKNEY